MNSFDLQKLAQHARSTREAGIAILLASLVLGLFLFVPVRETPIPQTVLELPTTDSFRNLPLEARAAIVYDLTTGETLFAKNADAQLPLASLTKLLTVYAALRELPPEARILISKQATETEDAYAFSAGDTLTLTDLARLTLTASLNDGAAALAEAVRARNNVSEAAMLANAAEGLNLAQTYAVNGSGLDMSSSLSGGYGSAQDIARLAGALVEQAPEIAEATTHRTAEAVGQGGKKFSVKNTAPVVSSIPGLLLSKTGYTELADGNLVLVFDAGIRHPIAVVVLGSTLKERFTDGASLVAGTFAHFANLASL
jgi:serine-type D-Ala-D-Ala carboxypeptidase (penicillin-binding protein 5/6)